MTITEKILAVHAGRKRVEPGDLVMAKIDLAVGNDVTAPIAIAEFKRAGAKKVFNRNKIVLVPSHFAPNKDIPSAEQCLILREFAREQGIKNYFEVGEAGIEHVLLPEKGLVLPGDLVIGADSHTCTMGALGTFSSGIGSTDLAAAMISGEAWFRVPESAKFIYRGRRKPWVAGKDLILHTIGDIGVDGALYRAMEFSGDTISSLPMHDRFTMCNMGVEAGAKNAIVVPDRITREFVKKHSRGPRKPAFYNSDGDANYADIREYDVSAIEPQVAFPHLPSNARPVSAVGNITVDQAFIGSCTNGHLEDLRLAAKVIKGKKKAAGVRLIVIPATPLIYFQAMREGLFSIFLNAGAVISTPTCGPCLGGYMGVLAKGERCLSTSNRNFRGRMGSLDSEVYLANPAVVAASAVLGRIASPGEL